MCLVLFTFLKDRCHAWFGLGILPGWADLHLDLLQRLLIEDPWTALAVLLFKFVERLAICLIAKAGLGRAVVHICEVTHRLSPRVLVGHFVLRSSVLHRCLQFLLNISEGLYFESGTLWAKRLHACDVGSAFVSVVTILESCLREAALFSFQRVLTTQCFYCQFSSLMSLLLSLLS